MNNDRQWRIAGAVLALSFGMIWVGDSLLRDQAGPVERAASSQGVLVDALLPPADDVIDIFMQMHRFAESPEKTIRVQLESDIRQQLQLALLEADRRQSDCPLSQRQWISAPLNDLAKLFERELCPAVHSSSREAVAGALAHLVTVIRADRDVRMQWIENTQPSGTPQSRCRAWRVHHEADRRSLHVVTN